jgi:hypothetical protein
VPNVRCRRGQCPRFVIRRRCQQSADAGVVVLAPHGRFRGPPAMPGAVAMLDVPPAPVRRSSAPARGSSAPARGSSAPARDRPHRPEDRPHRPEDGQGRSPRRRPDRIERPADADVADASVARPDRSRSRTLMINACGPLWLPRDLKGPDTLIHRGFPGAAQSVGAIRWLGGSVGWCRSHGVHQARSPSGTVSHALPAGASRSAASTLR